MEGTDRRAVVDSFTASQYSKQMIAGGCGASGANPATHQSSQGSMNKSEVRRRICLWRSAGPRTVLIKAFYQNTKCLSRGRKLLQTGTVRNLLFRRCWNRDGVSQRLPLFLSNAAEYLCSLIFLCHVCDWQRVKQPPFCLLCCLTTIVFSVSQKTVKAGFSFCFISFCSDCFSCACFLILYMYCEALLLIFA